MSARWRGGVVALALAAGALLLGCEGEAAPLGPLAAAEGDPDAGKAALELYGCGTCHRIPGIRTADGRVGPSLEGYGQQLYIAGAVENNVENLVQWITAPESIEPGTLMPNLGVAEQDARNIVAYLATLE